MSSRRTDLVGGAFENRYDVQKSVGNGRMSSVYLALDRDVGNREVAVKILDTEHPDEIRREAFRRETQALRRLRHPNVVEMLGGAWSESVGAFYLVLDYSPYSLDKAMRGEGGAALGGFDKHRVIRRLADALACAHAEMIVHRDIKTANILLDESGEPKLADFGVSKLLGHLTVGQTLAPFWSAGFASPEQRGGGAVGLESDVYSLGVVFFHMLTGEEPPPEGPSALALYRNRNIDAPQPLIETVVDMLELDPGKRPSAADVLTRLTEITRQRESLPTHSLILTNAAVRHLAETGHIPSQDRDSAAEALVRDLGGGESNEVSVHQHPRDDQGIIILGDSLRLVCKPSDERDALIVIEVRAPHGSSHDMEKSRSSPLRATWRVVNHMGWTPESAAADGLAKLIADVGHAETVGNVSRRQLQSRRGFIDRWRQALEKSVAEIENEAPRLPYASVEGDEDGVLTFTLRQPPPDAAAFGDDLPLAVVDSQNDSDFRKPVGALMSMRGRQVQADGLTQGGLAAVDDLPKSGTLTVDVSEASASIRRQMKAVDAFLYDRMANPRLGAAITDPARATRTPLKDISFYQDWLSDDKKDAVRRAVSSNELFLIQGPPGTGKTAVIAEIILQILDANPDARILLASQSNVAVDHALTRVSEAERETAPQMVRIGRPDKIGHGGEDWTLEKRAQAWRDEVLENLKPVEEELKADERAAEAAVLRASEAPPALEAREIPDGERDSENAAAAAELKRIQDLRKTVADWREVVGRTPDFQELIGKTSRVVASTCLFVGGRRGDVYGDDVPYDWTIVDEAGRATAPEILIPISKAERAILVGDERQLPPMLDENISREARGDSDDGDPLETSLFQTLMEQADESGGEYAAMLRTQYRMAPEIGNLVSAAFYDGKLENGARPPRDGFGWMPKPVTWFTTSYRNDRRESRRGSSFANAAEAEVVVELLEKLAAKPPPGSDPISVGVITGYSAQVDELTRRVNPRNRSKWRRLDIDVATVDSFQGRECDVVIYSTVRSNDRWTIGFLKDYRRVNVALSRARDLLLIVGDHAMMQNAAIDRAQNPFASVLKRISETPGECALERVEEVRLL